MYAIQNVIFEGEAEKIIARTPQGEITVLDNHVPLVTRVDGPSCEIISKEGIKNVIELTSGILEIRPESEVVLLVGA